LDTESETLDPGEFERIDEKAEPPLVIGAPIKYDSPSGNQILSGKQGRIIERGKHDEFDRFCKEDIKSALYVSVQNLNKMGFTFSSN